MWYRVYGVIFGGLGCGGFRGSGRWSIRISSGFASRNGASRRQSNTLAWIPPEERGTALVGQGSVGVGGA